MIMINPDSLTVIIILGIIIIALLIVLFIIDSKLSDKKQELYFTKSDLEEERKEHFDTFKLAQQAIQLNKELTKLLQEFNKKE